MLDQILNPWKLIPSLVILGTIGYYVVTYNQQKTKIAELKTEKKTLTDSLTTLNTQLKAQASDLKAQKAEAFETTRNYANRELSYQTTIAQQTMAKKKLEQLVDNMIAGLMCKEKYGLFGKKYRIVKCEDQPTDQ